MSAVIYYHDIGDYLSRDEKLKKIDDFGSIDGIEWKTLTPDEHGDWLNKRNSEFDDYVPLAPEKKGDYLTKSFFTTYAIGVATNRDAWATNSSKPAIEKSMRKTISFYNSCVEAKAEKSDPKSINWTRSLRNKLQKRELTSFRNEAIVKFAYRPFQKQWLYFDKTWNEAMGISATFFPTPEYKNKIICISDATVLITDCVADLHFCGDVQEFPLYWYEEVKPEKSVMELPGLEKQGGFIKHDAISDFILQEFRRVAGLHVQKEDIFNYVYGALHDPTYRAKFAADLKKQLPRLPLPKNKKEFEKVEKIGRELANLHLHYEEVDPWPLDEIGTLDYHVTKMAWAKDGKSVRKDMLVINDKLTLAGIPAEAHEYVVNGRTPLEWLIERYQVKTDADSGIVNDPNKWGEEHGYPEYIVELVKRVVRVSVETVALVKKLGGDGAAAASGTPQAVKSATPPYWWKSGVWGVPSPMPEGEHQTAGLKLKWYDKIEQGLKHEEFREKSPFWDARLGGRKGRNLRAFTFMKGRASKEQMTWEVTGVEERGNYYVINLGKRIA